MSKGEQQMTIEELLDAEDQSATVEGLAGDEDGSELPEGWRYVPLTDIIELHDNRRIPLNSRQRAERQGPYPYYGANGQVDSIDSYLFDGDYLLLAEDGGYFDDPSRSVAYEVSGQFWVNNHAHILSPKYNIPRRYLIYTLNCIDWLPYVGGSTRLKLTQEGMRKVRVPLPPPEEQRRIVATLDRLFARSKRARAELERVPRLVERMKQAVLAQAFSGELTAGWRERSHYLQPNLDRSGVDGRAVDLEEIPDNWCWTSIEQVALVTGGLTKNSKRNDIANRVAYLRVANVYANELRLNDITEIGCTNLEFAKTRLQAGDLLIVEGNGSIDQIGRVAIWSGEIANCSHQNHLIRARMTSSISPKYALFWLLSPGGRIAIERVASSSSGLHTLSVSKVEGLPIPVCNIEEQREIVRRIEAAFARIDGMAAEADRATALLDRLDQATLAKAFRGEL